MYRICLLYHNSHGIIPVVSIRHLEPLPYMVVLCECGRLLGVRVSIALSNLPPKNTQKATHRYNTPNTTPWNYKGCFILELPNSHLTYLHGTNRWTISSVVWFFLLKRSSDSDFSIEIFIWRFFWGVSSGVGFHFNTFFFHIQKLSGQVPKLTKFNSMYTFQVPQY